MICSVHYLEIKGGNDMIDITSMIFLKSLIEEREIKYYVNSEYEIIEDDNLIQYIINAKDTAKQGNRMASILGGIFLFDLCDSHTDRIFDPFNNNIPDNILKFMMNYIQIDDPELGSELNTFRIFIPKSDTKLSFGIDIDLTKWFNDVRKSHHDSIKDLANIDIDQKLVKSILTPVSTRIDEHLTHYKICKELLTNAFKACDEKFGENIVGYVPMKITKCQCDIMKDLCRNMKLKAILLSPDANTMIDPHHDKDIIHYQFLFGRENTKEGSIFGMPSSIFGIGTFT